MREIAAEFRLGHWAQILQDRAASGQSMRAYCKEKGIAFNVYFYWQRKLREAAVRQLSAITEQESQALIPSGWATVQETKPKQAGGLTLRVSGGEIEVRQGYDDALLTSVIKRLSQC